MSGTALPILGGPAAPVEALDSATAQVVQQAQGLEGQAQGPRDIRYIQTLRISVTDHCNFRCEMCNIWQKKSVDEMTPAEVEQVFTRYPQFRWVHLTGGELFMRRDLDDLVAGTDVNLEDFRLVHHGRTIKPVDRNFWGVTFGDDGDLFYATVAWDGKTWLVKGSLKQRQVVTVRSDVECPSLSPDGRHLAYKKRGDLPPGQWRLAAMDLATGREVFAVVKTVSIDHKSFGQYPERSGPEREEI